MFKLLPSTIPFLLLCVFYALSNQIKAQSIGQLKKLAMNTNKIVAAHGDSVEQFYLLKNSEKGKIATKENIDYWWYSGSQVNKAQGAVGGKLLHGEYSLYNRNKMLLERGVYFKGQKTGSWRQWYKEGSLKRKEEWKNGELKGSFLEFYPDGKLKKEGFYKRGTLHGRLKEYNEEGTVTKIRFRSGEAKERKVKQNNITENTSKYWGKMIAPIKKAFKKDKSDNHLKTKSKKVSAPERDKKIRFPFWKKKKNEDH